MLFLKNLIKICIVLIVAFSIMVSCVPVMWVAENVWPFTIPMCILIGTYCYTYKTDPNEMVEKFMKL